MTTRIVAENFNTSPPEERRPARLRPISTLKPGESIKVSLRGKHADTVNGWVGVIEAVDGVAVRIEASLCRFDMYWERASGIVVIPWQTIEHVTVQVDGQ